MIVKRKPTHIPTRPGHRLIVLLGALTLLLSLTAQIIDVQSVSAQQRLQTDEEENGEQIDQVLEPSYVFIDKYDCPAGSDWSQAEYGPLSGNCVPNQNPVNMTVGGQTQSMSASAQWGPYDGPVNIDISEEERQGYGPPHMFCGSYIPNQTTPSLNYVATANFTSWPLGAGESLNCQIYNYQVGDQFGTLIIEKYECPQSWNLTDPYQATIQELGQLCTKRMFGVSFDLYLQFDQFFTTLTTNDQGVASWDELPSGAMGLTEVLPSGFGFVVAHCSYQVANGENAVQAPMPMPMQGDDTFYWNHDPGYELYCYLFNFPVDQLQLFKYWCPAGVLDDPNNGPAQLAQLCTEPPAVQYNWQLSLTSNDQEIAQLLPSMAPPEYAGYHQFEQNQEIRIYEQIDPADGYGPPVVNCVEGQPGDPNLLSYDQPYDPETGMIWTPREGYYLICQYFNVPGEENGFGQIVIEKYWCPPGLTLGGDASQADMQAACQEPASSATFTLDGPSDGPQMWEMKSPEGGPPGSVFWDQLPAGDYQIAETNLGPDWVARVYCHESSGEPNGSTPELQQLVNGSGIQWTIQAGHTLACAWFNEPVDEQDGNAVTVYKWDCLPGTEYGQSHDYYMGGLPEQDTGPCETQHTNIPIALIDANGERATTTQSDGTSWDDVVLDANGSYQIMEQIPDGYGDPMVFCGTLDDDQQQMVMATGGMISITPSSEPFTYQCNWYNIPGEQNYNIVDFYKYECAFDAPLDADKDYYEANCLPVEGWQFDLQYVGGGSTQATNASGLASWSGLPTGTWQSTETLPPDYGDPIVYCRYVEWPEEAGVTGEWARFDAPGGAYDNGFGYENMRIECHWYNFPPDGEDGNAVTVYKWDCLPGTEVGQSHDYYQGGLPEQDTGPCETQHTNIPIALIDANGERATTTQSDGTSWDDVVLDANGSYQIMEQIPDGYGDPMVFCGTLDDDQQQMVMATGGMISITPSSEPFTYQCNWYNIPEDEEDGNSVTVYKWDCMPGTEVGQSHDYYQGGLLEQDTGPCETQHTNIPIALIDANGERATTTQSDGTSWGNVVLDANGSYQITEQIPAGYGDPMVFCGTLDDETQQMVTATGGMISISPSSEPFTYQCNWYNIPLPQDYNIVDFYKYECAIGIPLDAEKSYYEANCLPIEGWEFDLQYTDGGSTQTTNSSGRASWSGLPTGTWQSSETVPPDYGDPVVWCRYVEWPDEAGVDGQWARFDAPGGTYDNGFGYENMRIECHWYNFAPGVDLADEPGTNWLTIYKYLCAPETEVSENLADMLERCTESHSGVPFSLSGGDLGNPIEQSTVGGTAEWSGLNPGAYAIQETLPPGYGEPLIWCGYLVQGGVEVSSENQQFTAYTSAEAAVEAQLEGQDNRLVCYWFNFPGDENTVTVYKYECDIDPAGYQTLGEWQEACPTQGNDHTFTLTESGGIPSEMTTAAGTASWSDLAQGGFTLSESIQSGWAEPVVWCGWTAYYDGAVYDAFPQQVVTTGGIYNGEISVPGTTYFCYWFNIPLDDSRVTVYKYICPDGRLEGVVPDPLQAYLEMCTTKGNGIEFTLENSAGSSSATILDGYIRWTDLPQGPFSITETVPEGYDPPIWFCWVSGYQDGVYVAGSASQVPSSAVFSSSIDYEVTNYYCWVFNFPDPDRTVQVYKWLCPEGYIGNSYEEWSSNCTMPLNNVKFTLTDEQGSWSQFTIFGTATWYGVSQGDVTLREHIPPGYFDPVVYCTLEAVNGAALAEGPTEYTPTNGAISRSLDYGEFTWVCHFFNQPKGPGDITIYKWLCPPGYDFYGWGADPKMDCIQAYNDVTFTLDQPVGPNLQSDTGDSIPGAVYFGGLDPGKYVVYETVPAGIEYVFVLDCVGSDVGKVHPYPLQWGNVLTLDVAGGDTIVCNWYNVPKPEKGWVTVYKYQCWTPTFTSAVDCEIYEHGASFELFGYPSNTSYGVGTTNQGGLYTWQNLPNGAYVIKETSHKPCKITTTKTDGKGRAWVDQSQGTVIKVYNCKPKTPPPPGKPTVPGKPPGKYPNTGVGPTSASVAESMAQATPEGTPEVSEEEYYKISCLDEAPPATPAAPEVAEVEADVTPTVTPTPSEFDLPIEEDEEAEATPAGGTPEPEEECLRGALPERVVIDAAQVNAGVEILEIIDGEMEQPTGSELVTWYKETGRLGENNNIVIAGHLNWWGVPQAVFYSLDQLREGDVVEITGDDGLIYIFEVQWVRQESNLEPPALDVIGPTDEPMLTLITCGGTWDPSISEYNERTVARAIQVDVRSPDAPLS